MYTTPPFPATHLHPPVMETGKKTLNSLLPCFVLPAPPDQRMQEQQPARRELLREMQGHGTAGQCWDSVFCEMQPLLSLSARSHPLLLSLSFTHNTLLYSNCCVHAKQHTNLWHVPRFPLSYSEPFNHKRSMSKCQASHSHPTFEALHERKFF